MPEDSPARNFDPSAYITPQRIFSEIGSAHFRTHPTRDVAVILIVNHDLNKRGISDQDPKWLEVLHHIINCEGEGYLKHKLAPAVNQLKWGMPRGGIPQPSSDELAFKKFNPFALVNPPGSLRFWLN